ncbi:MAG TPA: CoA-binding protein [Bryobacteraceae bacterium]|nr:CoA-binding protein [Bryobacteraceae bacterium]
MSSSMNDTQMAALLSTAKTIAVVGLSSNPMRPSFGVSEYLQNHGYRIIPVNPRETEVLGEKCYGSLLEVPDSIDIVDIFRRSDGVPEVVDESIQKGTRCIWMQEGVVHAEASAKAEAAGIPVVMDLCILKEHRRLTRR